MIFVVVELFLINFNLIYIMFSCNCLCLDTGTKILFSSFIFTYSIHRLSIYGFLKSPLIELAPSSSSSHDPLLDVNLIFRLVIW